MSVAATAWLVAVGVWLAMAITHIAVTRLWKIPASGQIKANSRLYLICAPTVAIVTYWALGDGLHPYSTGWDLFTTLMFHLTSLGLMMAFYSALDHSVRIRLCAEFFQAKKSLSYDEIRERYSVDAATERRLGKILGSGYATREGPRFGLSAKGSKMGTLLARLKSIYEFTGSA